MGNNKPLIIILIALSVGVVLTSAGVVFMMLRSNPQNDSAGPDTQALPGQHIVFQSDRLDDNHLTGIYIMESDGSDQRLLFGSEQGVCTLPSWSPDGLNIVYTVGAPGENGILGDEDDITEIWLARSDGSEQIRLDELIEGETGSWIRIPWSPDGTQLAIISHPPENRNSSDIHIITARDGTLAQVISIPLLVYAIRWSPTASEMLIGHAIDSIGIGVSLLTLDNQQLNLIYQNAATANWSPDGTEIIIGTETSQQVVAVGRDGAPRWSVQLDQGYPEDVTWSPDGRHIAISAGSTYDHGPDLMFIVTAETGEITRVSRDNFWFHFPEWSPDSRYVMVTSTFERQNSDILPGANVWLYDVDTGEMAQLTDGTAHDGMGAWSP